MISHKTLEDPHIFLSDHSDASNAAVTQLAWNKQNAILEFALDDLDSDFVGLPGYEGERPVSLQFHKVHNLETNLVAPHPNCQIRRIFITRRKRDFALDLEGRYGEFMKFLCDEVRVADLSE